MYRIVSLQKELDFITAEYWSRRIELTTDHSGNYRQILELMKHLLYQIDYYKTMLKVADSKIEALTPVEVKDENKD